MKKLSKILLPITSVAAIAAPVMTLTSCGLTWEDVELNWTWKAKDKCFTTIPITLLKKHNYGLIFNFDLWWDTEGVEDYPIGILSLDSDDLIPIDIKPKVLAVYLIDNEDSTNETQLVKNVDYEVSDNNRNVTLLKKTGIDLQGYSIRVVWTVNISTSAFYLKAS